MSAIGALYAFATFIVLIGAGLFGLSALVGDRYGYPLLGSSIMVGGIGIAMFIAIMVGSALS